MIISVFMFLAVLSSQGHSKDVSISFGVIDKAESTATDDACPICFDVGKDTYPADCLDDQLAATACEGDTVCFKVILKKETEIKGSPNRTTSMAFFCATSEEAAQYTGRVESGYYLNVANLLLSHETLPPASPTTFPTTQPKATEAENNAGKEGATTEKPPPTTKKPAPTSICSLGQKLGESGTCAVCPLNTYSNTTNAATCTPCPDDQITEKTAAVSVEECKSRAALNRTSAFTFLLIVLYLVL